MLSAHALAAPLHRHTREDEYSYILEGRVGALLGEELVIGSPVDLIFKPRNQWHTFWNAGDDPARLLEIISPAGRDGELKTDWTKPPRQSLPPRTTYGR